MEGARALGSALCPSLTSQTESCFCAAIYTSLSLHGYNYKGVLHMFQVAKHRKTLKIMRGMVSQAAIGVLCPSSTKGTDNEDG